MGRVFLSCVLFLGGMAIVGAILISASTRTEGSPSVHAVIDVEGLIRRVEKLEGDIGEIRISLLGEDDFRKKYGEEWALLNGQEIERLTGPSNEEKSRLKDLCNDGEMLPDMKNRFLMGVTKPNKGGQHGKGGVGAHWHFVARLAVGERERTPSNQRSFSNSSGHQPSANGNLKKTIVTQVDNLGDSAYHFAVLNEEADCGLTSSVIQKKVGEPNPDAENQPKNLSVYMYMKVCGKLH